MNGFVVARARMLMARSTAFIASLAPVFARSRALRRQGRERRLTSVSPRLRAIAGGSDAGLIATVLGVAPLCGDCIAKRTGVPADHIDTVVSTIGTTLKLMVGPGECHLCLEAKRTTYRLMTTNGAHHPGSQHEGVWRFLEAHRGAMFCTACVAASLGVTRRIDRAVLAAEGRGALRRYGKCAGCGRDRLLCGLASG